MPNRSTLITANGYLYVSLRYPVTTFAISSGIKDNDNLSKIDTGKQESTRNMVNDYVMGAWGYLNLLL